MCLFGGFVAANATLPTNAVSKRKYLAKDIGKWPAFVANKDNPVMG